jgi:hypothetical protein
MIPAKREMGSMGEVYHGTKKIKEMLSTEN